MFRRVTIKEIWRNPELDAWSYAEEQLYWDRVRLSAGGDAAAALRRERRMERGNLRQSITGMTASEFFDFLRDEFFPWKFASARFYPVIMGHLLKTPPDRIREAQARLIDRKDDDKRTSLLAAMSIGGMGVPGATGLLSLIYPETFAGVDKQVVTALKAIGLPEVSDVNGNAITLKAGLIVDEIIGRKAEELSQIFGRTKKWTPRMVDKALWATHGEAFFVRQPQSERSA